MPLGGETVWGCDCGLAALAGAVVAVVGVGAGAGLLEEAVDGAAVVGGDREDGAATLAGEETGADSVAGAVGGVPAVGVELGWAELG